MDLKINVSCFKWTRNNNNNIRIFPILKIIILCVNVRTIFIQNTSDNFLMFEFECLTCHRGRLSANDFSFERIFLKWRTDDLVPHWRPKLEHRTSRLRKFQSQDSVFHETAYDLRFSGLEHDVIRKFSEQNCLEIWVDVSNFIARKLSVAFGLREVLMNLFLFVRSSTDVKSTTESFVEA